MSPLTKKKSFCSSEAFVNGFYLNSHYSLGLQFSFLLPVCIGRLLVIQWELYYPTLTLYFTALKMLLYALSVLLPPCYALSAELNCSAVIYFTWGIFLNSFTPLTAHINIILCSPNPQLHKPSYQACWFTFLP